MQPCESVAVTTKLKLPLAVGVPESIPLVARVNPGGRVPPVSVKVKPPEPPVAVIVWL